MTYNQALQIDQDAGGANGIDKAVGMFMLDAIATPTGTAPWTTDVINGDHFEFATSTLAAIVGYPIVNVPMGQMFGLSLGISFIGPAFSELALIRVASGFENVTRARLVPKLFQTLPLDVDGIR
jgi:amidase